MFDSTLEAAQAAADTGEIDALEWLSADVALARTASSGRAPGYQTYLLVRRAGAWRIRSFQHTATSKIALWAAQRVRRGAG
jgi:hypothetical protein